MGRKIGQLQISFGMIFSIMIIAATLAVAGYVIFKFVNLETNISCKLFANDIQERIDKAWRADGETSDIIEHSAPDKAERICFGEVSLQPSSLDKDYHEFLKTYSKKENNLFFYSEDKKICGGDKFAYTLEHASFSSFFCLSEENGKISIKISKRTSEPLVSLKP